MTDRGGAAISHVVKSIEIDAPRERVFAYASQINRQPEWIYFLKSVKSKEGDGRTPGSTEQRTIKLGPRKLPYDCELVNFKPNEMCERRYDGEMTMRERLRFESKNDRTVVRWFIQYKPPMGAIGAVGDLLFMNRVFQNEVEESLDRLRAAIEGY